jgi:hypothetical protein
VQGDIKESGSKERRWGRERPGKRACRDDRVCEGEERVTESKPKKEGRQHKELEK